MEIIDTNYINDREIVINYKNDNTVYLTIEQSTDDVFELEQLGQWSGILEYIENVQMDDFMNPIDDFMNPICEYVEEKYNIKIWSTATYIPNNEEMSNGALLYIHLGFK